MARIQESEDPLVWRRGMISLLAYTQTVNTPYETRVLGLDFFVLSEVFSPLFYSETELFAGSMPSQKGKAFLEIGCGTGVISVVAARHGAARVVAADVNPHAVANTRLNVERHGLTDIIAIRQGDLFDPIEAEQRFDTIFWALPVADIDRPRSRLSILERAIFDPGFELCRRFMELGRSYLAPNGRLLFGASPTLGDAAAVTRIAEANGVDLRVLAETQTMDEDRPVSSRWPITWQLVEGTYREP